MLLNWTLISILLSTLHHVPAEEYENSQNQQNLQCDNNPNYQRLDIPIHEDTILALSNETYRSNVLFIPRISDQRPYIYHIKGTKPGQEFIICTTPKSGNTRIKMMLQRIQNKKKNIYSYSQYNPLAWKSAKEIQELLLNPDIPRFVVARDPYIRAISMYNDKIIQSADVPNSQSISLVKSLHLNPKFRKDIKFDDFVEALYYRRFGNDVHLEHPLDRHFQTQSTLCGLDLGLTYNYILRLEDMNDWYDCFIEGINSREEVMHGYPGSDNCYFSSPKVPCNGPVLQPNGVMASLLNKKSIKHQTGSAALVDQFYTNDTTLKMVTQIFWEDIINFNYKFL